MSDGDKPHEASPIYRFLRGFLLFVGLAAYLSSLALAAAIVSSICDVRLGVAMGVAGVLITFRWFSRDLDERDQRAGLKRGASFACPFVVMPVFITLMALAFPPVGLIKPELIADTAMAIGALAPLAFGIGVVTSK